MVKICSKRQKTLFRYFGIHVQSRGPLGFRLRAKEFVSIIEIPTDKVGNNENAQKSKIRSELPFLAFLVEQDVDLLYGPSGRLKVAE